jgi:hypothetical protein
MTKDSNQSPSERDSRFGEFIDLERLLLLKAYGPL